MKIRKILNEHQRHQPEGSLADNLGDGYLMNHNPVFKNIRQAAMKAGIRFSSTRFHEYDVLPLIQLPKILEEKTVPYLPNVKPLIEIESVMPDQFQIYEAPPLRANYVMHESAHVLARILRVKILGEMSLVPSSKNTVPTSGGARVQSERQLALGIMMEEAFANAAETLLSLAATNAIHDEFVMKNAYVHEQPEMRGRLRAAVAKLGFDPVFKVVFYSFLHSNLLKRKISPKDLDRVFRLALGGKTQSKNAVSSTSNQKGATVPGAASSIDQKLQKDLREIFHGGFDLDPMFTGLTSSFCLRFMGMKTPLQNLFDFDFMARVESSPAHLQLVNAYSALMEKGVWNA